MSDSSFFKNIECYVKSGLSTNVHDGRHLFRYVYCISTFCYEVIRHLPTARHDFHNRKPLNIEDKIGHMTCVHEHIWSKLYRIFSI